MPDASTEDGALISEAAALYGIQPSTLRWWEKQDVVDQPARVGPYRRYTNRDLRQIGMAHLCCVVGKMPLDRAAVVTSRRTDRQTWRNAVTEQIAQLDRDISDLRTAREFLVHLSLCEAEVVSDCHHLDGGSDLVLKARKAINRHASRKGDRGARLRAADGGSPDVKDSEADAFCPTCGEKMTPATGRGRPRKYCSRTCRQRAYRLRQSRRPPT